MKSNVRRRQQPCSRGSDFSDVLVPEKCPIRELLGEDFIVLTQNFAPEEVAAVFWAMQKVIEWVTKNGHGHIQLHAIDHRITSVHKHTISNYKDPKKSPKLS